MSKQYEAAGVSLEAGYESVRRIKKHVARTSVPGVMGGIGSFGGMFDLSGLGYKEPVLVSGTDGVGTKLKLAFMMDKHDTIGQDVVAMCVNDVLAQGAKPLFFLDYVAVGKNHPEKIEQIVKGVADGCVLADCALIGGETAEMPGMYGDGEYDIAGYTTGVVEKSKLIDGTKVKVGDVVLFTPEQRKKVLELAEEGNYNLTQLAIHAGVSKPQARLILKNKDNPDAFDYAYHPSDEEVKEIKELARHGYSPAKIARTLGGGATVPAIKKILESEKK